MKKASIIFALLAILFTAAPKNANAQFNPYPDHDKMLSAGFGITGWGVPIYARIEFPVYDNVTVGGGFSFQTKTENYFGYKYKHTIFGIIARGDYHFNELLEISDEWDVYAGLGLGYVNWNTKYEGGGTTITYGGAGSGGFSIGVHVGGRYFFSDNWAANLEFGGGNVLSGATIGVTYLF